MITSVYFNNFKALTKFSISLKNFNILVGLNNSGKSTILDAFRILQGSYRFASRKNPKYIVLPNGKAITGYEIPFNSLPIVLDNLQTNYNDEPSEIKYHFKDGQNIYITFFNTTPYLHFDTPRTLPRTSSSFKKEFPINLNVIPTLGPLETVENILEEEYVKRWYGSRRAPRMFRNIWYYFSDDFELFKKLVEDTWKGMTIHLPEKGQAFSNELYMLCEENRLSREVCWAGFGFQIWLQLLTQIVKSKNADIIVVDEPEIYLHPDLQHKIIDILKETKSKIILATHSVEIINHAEPNEVLLIDKKNQSAKRISDIYSLQDISLLLGSSQNLQLTKLINSKKVLFVEGEDAKILSKFSKITGHENLFSSELTVIPIKGFSNHERIIHANWAFSKVLGQELKFVVLLDRDYRSNSAIEKIIENFRNQNIDIHILKRKEIENYLLSITALNSAIEERIRSRQRNNFDKDILDFDFSKLIREITDEFKSYTYGQLLKELFLIRGKEDQSVVFSDHYCNFEQDWDNIDYRLSVICGKEFIAKLNEKIQEKLGVSITPTLIINNMKKCEVDPDLIDFFNKLDKFMINN